MPYITKIRQFQMGEMQGLNAQRRLFLEEFRNGYEPFAIVPGIVPDNPFDPEECLTFYFRREISGKEASDAEFGWIDIEDLFGLKEPEPVEQESEDQD